MRAQFYILSIVILVAIIVTFGVGMLETPTSDYAPDQIQFLLNNLESEAQTAFEIGKARNNLEATFENFVETTEAELAKEQISVDWDYSLSSTEIEATLTLKSGNTIVTDSWTIG